MTLSGNGAVVIIILSLTIVGMTVPGAGAGGLVGTAQAQSSTEKGPIDVAASDLPGDGSNSDPYEISNVSELQAMEDDLDANYELVSDIDALNTAQFNNGRGFDPVGEFTGSFDGSGFTITGLTIDRPGESDIGLFGVVVGTVTDITLTNATVTGNEDVGRLAGSVSGDSRFQEITASGEVSGKKDVGGIAGVATDSSIFQDITASGVVNSTQDQNVGGTRWRDLR